MPPSDAESRGLAARVARITTHPGASAAVVGGLSLFAALLLPAVQIETDVSRLLPEKNPVTRLHRALDARTGVSRSLYVLVDPGDRELEGLFADLRASPYVERVDAKRAALLGASERLSRAPLWYLPSAVLSKVEDRVLGEGRTQAILQTRERLADDPFGGREVALADPLGLRALFSEGAEAMSERRFDLESPYLRFRETGEVLFRVVGRKSPFDTPFTEALLEDLQARLAGFEPRLVGSYARVAGDAARIARDLVVSASASVLLVGLFLAWALRRAVDAAAVLLPVAVALFWTMPIGGALLGALTPLTMSSAAILMGLGVDFSIHYLVRYREARTSAEHREAVQVTLRSVGRPLLTALLTTALAFLSFVVAEFDGLRVFGWLLALGLGFAFLSCLFVTPWILRLGPAASRPRPRSPVVLGLERLRAGPAGRPLAAGLPLLGLLGFVLAGTLGVPFSTDSRHLRPFDDPGWKAERALEARLGQGLAPLFLVFPEGTTNDALRVGYRELEGLVAHTDRPDLSEVPPGREARLAALRGRLDGWLEAALVDVEQADLSPQPFREGLESTRARLLATPPSIVAEAAGPVEAVLGAPSVVVSTFLRGGLHEVDAWRPLQGRLRSAMPEGLRASHVYALLQEMQAVLGRDMRQAGLITAAIALVLLFALTGGIRAGLVAAVPAFSTLGVTLGVMAVFDLPLNMSNCVAVPFLLGIGVDAGIHLVAELRRGEALERGTASVAVWRTSATTALGFGSLALATVPGIASLGVIMMVGVTTAFATSLLVLPAAWSRLGPREPRS